MNNICIIPARGGSKRIPKKNIKNFLGRPIIKYSIEAAFETGLFKDVIVSTDNHEISKLSSQLGASIPFIRPKSISDDFSGITEVVAHSIAYLKLNNIKIDNICCLFATAPFVKVEEIKKGFQLLNLVKKDRFIFTAAKFSFPIQRSFCLDRNKLALPFDKFATNERSQDLKDYFHDAGQFYWGKPEAWLSNKNFFEESMPLIIPSWRVQDIDTLEDWQRAELIYNLTINK